MEKDAQTRLVFVGGGRLAGMLYSTFRRQYEILGYVDDVNADAAYMRTKYDVAYLGTSDALGPLKADGVKAVISITDAAARRKYGQLLATLRFELMTLVFPTAVIDENAHVGTGCIVRHQAVIGAQVRLGRNCVVSDNAYVGHDSVIGAHTYISPGVNINGSVTVGEASFVGTGAVILPERRIGADCTVGAAACVVADVPDGQTVAGVPARLLARTRNAPAGVAKPASPKPLVSVLMASYNHEKYVAEAIQSVLDQTLADLEFVIVDDGSTDGTTDVIRSFRDRRIRYVPLGHNHGLAVAKRRAMELAHGTYVAIINSDDAFLPEKLETQLLVLEDHPEMGAVFTGVEVVDEGGHAFGQEDHPYFKVFKQANRSRPEWLRRFFYEGNCLCAPSVLMPRERILEIGYLDRRFRQLADFDLWIRLCFKHPIYIVPGCLTRFRVRDGAANASAFTPETQARDLWEYRHLLRQYSRISSEEELLRIFPEAVVYSDPDEPLDAGGIAYVVSRLALDHGGQCWEHFALETLFDLVADDRRAARIQARFGFGYPEFIELTGRRAVSGLP